VLTPEGARFLAASIPERKQIFREHAKSLRIFHDVLALLERADRHEVDVDVVLSSLALHVPYEDPDRMLTTLVNWGRHADLFDYDPERGRLVGDPPPPNAAAAAVQ
jgi:NitT/TauT family transport system ATP-binding protein